MSQVKGELKYTYSSLGIELRKEQLYPGERIIYKNEKMKFMDNKNNKFYDTNIYYTNFRIVVCSDDYLFDIPLMYIKSHWTKKPFFSSVNSSYIQCDLQNNIFLGSSCPRYIYDNFSQGEIMNTNYTLPGYIQIKFKHNPEDLDNSYNFLKKAINGKEWMIKFKKPEPPNPIQQQNYNNFNNNNFNNNNFNNNNFNNFNNNNFNNNNFNNNNFNNYNNFQNYNNNIDVPQFNINNDVGENGLGLSRIQNIQRKKINNQNKMISGSFNNIETFRQNSEELISLAQQIRAKLSISKANINENASQAAEINSILSKIGFIDPVTKEVAGSDYYIKLAEQINLYFTDYFKKNPDIKVITLIDAYCIYNRARGGNTISPKDMSQAIDNFDKVAGEIKIKNFNKEMIVLHTNEFSNENLINLIKKHMQQNNKDYIELKSLSNIINVKNVLLETILIDDLLNNGLLLIDEFDLDVRYYLNKILNYKIK